MLRISRFLAVATLFGLLAASQPARADVIIDHFQTAQLLGVTNGTSGIDGVSAPTSEIYGGARKVTLTATTSGGPPPDTIVSFADVPGGTGIATVTSTLSGPGSGTTTALLVYDGTTTGNVNPNPGFPTLNVTNNNLVLEFSKTNPDPGQVRFRLYDATGAFSQFFATLPNTGGLLTPLVINTASFTGSANLGAITALTALFTSPIATANDLGASYNIAIDDIRFTAIGVPEPSTMLGAGAGLVMLALGYLRRRRNLLSVA